MPWDDERIGSVLQDMLSAGMRPAAPLSASELRMKARRRSTPRIDTKALVAVAALVTVFIVVVAAGPLRGDRQPATGVRGSAAGWYAHSAYGLQISAPKTWAVEVFGQCPDGTKPGTLFIGTSSFVDSCPGYVSTTTRVDMFQGAAPGNPASPRAQVVRVHGLAVLSSSSGPEEQWYVPSRHVTVTGSGPQASEVMRTLAPATRRAVPAEGQVVGTEYLEALMQAPVTGAATATRQGSKAVYRLHVVDGMFTFGGPPGNYVVIGSDGNTRCSSVAVTILAGQTVDAPAIRCQGE